MLEINPSIFKAYDIRGIYPDEVNEEVAYRVGRAFVVFTGAKSVVVGRDCRLSSDSLFEALEKGILEEGADVIDIGLVSSPLFYFSVGDYDLSKRSPAGRHDAGIMLTASHNPKQYNGFKLVRGNALPIGGVSGMDEIKKLVLENVWDDKPAGTTLETSVIDDYIEKILSFTNPPQSPFKKGGTNPPQSPFKKGGTNPPQSPFMKGGSKGGFKVAADAGNGMGGISLQKLAEKLPIKLIPLFFKPDGNFPNHEANPTKPENLADLQKKVLKEKADFGIALDGDGDRIAVVDEKGEVVRGDYLTAIFAEMMLEKYPGAKILYDVRCSNVVPETIRKFGGVPQMTPVGHAPIKNIMAKGGAVFGGELSNHFYFRDFYFAESPDLCLLLLLEYLSKKNKKMSEVVSPLQKYFHSGEINFEVKDKEAVMKRIKERYVAAADLSRRSLADGGAKAEKITEIDGLRLDFSAGSPEGRNDWWFNVRASNTEPLLRLNLEAKNQGLMEQKVEDLTNLILCGKI